ncbi:hypothetical protein ATK36_6011 [Amycolatopsis sulphurea]|uniref:Uncharacterized protein n=1 Tax=Amycolatopsis sulphurea TaxID=76022 RepID=A0A2A9FJ45_9PSEU|nr:hypothetical protein ATK36_6011 [Amycolatopsis sulphurea]
MSVIEKQRGTAAESGTAVFARTPVQKLFTT